MNRKIVGILVVTLLLSVTTFIVTAEKIDNECGEDDVKCVNFVGNSPPSDPEITAPEEVMAKRWFKVYVVSTDPDGDDVYYRYKYPNDLTPSEWWGPWPSGEEQYSLVKIYEPCEITMEWQTKDVHGAESGWAYHTVTITKVKSNYAYMLEPLMQRFPLLARLLQLPVFNKLLNLQ